MAPRPRQARAHEILQRFFDRKRKRNPAYSLRALARDLGLSPSYASRMLKGEKPISPDRLERIADVLEIDQIGRELLEKALIHTVVAKKIRGRLPVERALQAAESELAAEYRELEFGKFPMLEQWYHLAILNLITCENFENDPTMIARRLAIPVEDARDSIALLRKLGVVEEKDGVLSVVEEKLRFPAKSSDPRIRHHHRQMIQKAQHQLLNRTTQRDYDRRLITSITLACDVSRLEEAKGRIEEAMFEATKILSDGECTEVYQYNVQLFPLTESKK